MATITVRDVPEELIAEIDKAIAQAGYRSREAGLRAVLDRHFRGRGNTVADISGRLRGALDHILDLAERHHFDHRWLPSLPQIARDLGHPDTSAIDAVYRGDLPVSFSDGDRICEMFGLDRAWLERGASEPYYQDAKFDDDGLRLLLDIYANGWHHEHLAFALADEERGEAVVFARVSPYRYVKLLEGVPIHSDVGAGGTIGLTNFCYLLAAIGHLQNAKHNILRRALGSRSHLQTYIRAVGVVLDPQSYRELVFGKVHPAAVFDKPGCSNSLWHEDLADLEYLKDVDQRYTDNWRKAKALFASSVKFQGIDTNKDLLRYIYQELLRHTRPSDADLANMLRARDSQPKSHAHYDAIVASARSGNAQAHARLLELFEGNCIPLPDWLDFMTYVQGVQNVTGYQDLWQQAV
jgi:hypothetical protein